jgi:hypothetical protein
MSFAVFNQPGETELGCALHDRIGTRTEKLDIRSEKVMFKQVLAEPGPAHIPIGPRRLAYAFAYRIGSAPDIDIVVRNPTGETIRFFRGLPAGLT